MATDITNSSTVQRSWMPVFRYLIQIGWRRFALLWFLGAITAGISTGILSSAGLHDGLQDVVMLAYMMSSALMVLARVVLRNNPEYMPADHLVTQAEVNVPAPSGQLAYAGWLLARMSWLSFIGLCFVLLMMGLYLSSLVKPPPITIASDARPVRVIVKEATQKDKTTKSSEIIIDEEGVHLRKIKPGAAKPPIPPVPPVAPVAPTEPSVVFDKDKGKITLGAEGIRIEKMENGVKKIITVNGNGVQVSQADVESAMKDPQRAAEAMKNAEDSSKQASADAAKAQADAQRAQDTAQAAKDDAEAAAADAEAAADEANAQVVTIDLGKGDATQIAKAVKDALTKARGTIEEDVRDSIELEKSQGFQLPWNKLIKALTVLSLLLLTGLKITANAQYAARASAMRATQRAEGETLKRQLSDAQLKAMQAQVEPHFLFNTLASVDYLIETAPAQASKMQKSLISYLRAALPQMRQASTNLGREAKLITSYLEILKVRMEERLQTQVDIPSSLQSAEFPPMMLQSLVENAIKHGLEPKPEGGTLKVKAWKEGDKLVLEVADTGVGLATTGRAAPTAGTGLGLNNIRERLEMLYGKRAQFTLAPNMMEGVATGTIARVELPYEVSAQNT
jgi:signal transduction histidine kinase